MEEGGGGRGSLGPASKRQFRGQRTETPSHPGGVNEDVRRDIDDRRKAGPAGYYPPQPHHTRFKPSFLE